MLAWAVLGGSGLAAGDLFDDAYKDCPHRTRLQDGQIDDLAVARDADVADEVNVSWTATDPDTWGLGANAFRTSLVVILDDHDGDPVSRTLSLGSRKTTFDGVDTGTEVTVEMAIVVDTADGKYLISDILKKETHQSLTAPAFMADVVQTTTAGTTSATDTEKRSGTFYYVGYNESFLNYRTQGLTTMPRTASLRIGLAHTELDADGNRYQSDNDKGPYKAVDFDAYIVRITDAEGDVVPEGNDVATVPTEQGKVLWWGVSLRALDDKVKFSNVRINEGGEILAPLLSGSPKIPGLSPYTEPSRELGQTGLTLVRIEDVDRVGKGDVFSMPPNEHRDFPIDVLASDETYTLTAWAVNEEGEVISPVESLRVHPIDERRSDITRIADYLNPGLPGASVSDVYVTEFTVLK